MIPPFWKLPKYWHWASCACGKNNLHFLVPKDRFNWTSALFRAFVLRHLTTLGNTMNNNVLAQINDLKTLTMKQLRQRWIVLFTTDPPAYGRSYLERRLAYRLQELAHGTDTARLERRMIEAAKGRFSKQKGRAEDIYRPVNGTRLTREWQGEEHQVTVLIDGFEYRGQKYNSLSRIAKTITGTVWSGPVFFGLKRVRS